MFPKEEWRDMRDRIYGVVIGVVTNNHDPDGKYRVKVRFPWLPNGAEQGGEDSAWCRVATVMAGPDRGLFCLPEVKDEVLVAFEHGDVSCPYVVGSLWNGSDRPPYDNRSGKNSLRAFRSRSGHRLEFCDDAENHREQIRLRTAGGAEILLDDSEGARKIEIRDERSTQMIQLDLEKRTLTIVSEGDLVIKAKKSLRLEAETFELSATGAARLKAQQNLELTAASNLALKASGGARVETSSTLTLRGAKVNIN
jgi:uncharacterized protein involved in type VI secretion and phage assembly